MRALVESPPKLSVVVATYNARATVDVCLDSLHRQKTGEPFEIILVDSSTDGTADHVRRHYPRVRLLESPDRLYCGDARNLAMKVAEAPIVAFLDADCFVDENWIESVLEAHRSPHWLVGGIIDNGSRRSLVSWAYYFCEFSLWLPRSKPAEIAEIAGCCLSFKREAFEKYGPFLCGTYCSDTAFHWRVQRDGYKVLFAPSIRVFHTVDSKVLEFLEHVMMHRSYFTRVALSQKKLAAWQRPLLAALAPVYPFLLTALTAGRVLRCPRYLPVFLISLPLVFLAFCARAWGEVIGLFTQARAPAGHGAAAAEAPAGEVTVDL
jgi:GT2 family glycosyltransferase